MTGLGFDPGISPTVSGNNHCRIVVNSVQAATVPTATVALSLLAHGATVVLLLMILSGRIGSPALPTALSVAFAFEPVPASSPAAVDVALPEIPTIEPTPTASAAPLQADPAPLQDTHPVAAEPSPPVPAPSPKRVVTPRAHSAPSRPPTSPAPAETQSASVAPVLRTATAMLLVSPRPVAGMETNRAPIYPQIALRRGEEGRVMLRVSVSAEGTPLEVALLETSGHPNLDSAALSAVRQWRFVPAMQAGTPVSAIAEVPVRFRIDH